MILSICDSPNFMEAMNIINKIIDILKIVVPLILLFSLIFKLIQASTKNDNDALAVIKKKAVPSIIAAALIFLVPTFVALFVEVSTSGSEYKNCMAFVSQDIIDGLYEEKAEKLLDRLEETLELSDYTKIKSYISKIKDETKKEEFEKRLEISKEIIDKNRQPSAIYSTVVYSDFKWTYYHEKKGPASEKYDDMMAYAVYTPDEKVSLNGVSLPLIVWLHGEDESIWKIKEQNKDVPKTFLNSGLPKVVSNWNKYNLASIPAVIVAPNTNSSWNTEREFRSIKGLIEYYVEKYNLNPSKVILMGHSMGGRGTIYASYGMQKMFSKNYFNAIVPMSFLLTGPYPSDDVENGYNYFSKIKIRGYIESPDKNGFFEWLNQTNNLIYLEKTSHADVPEKALTQDLNNDGVSDLMYFLFGEAAKIVPPANETDDKSLSSDWPYPGLPGGDGVYIPPGERPITDYVNINATNRQIANAVNRSGLYTRGAVVNAALTLISSTESQGYYIPYQLGGMYHRGNSWGLNSEWGTLITHNNKQVLSGLDCRNFVNWSFKQAGLSLIRGFGYEGSNQRDMDNIYRDISQGRPGDVIDANPHIMLIVSNNGNSYTVAESNGVGRVRTHDYTYADLQRCGYRVYNMDAVYNDTGKYCKENSSYRAYSGSCHIPKSEFPSYYGFTKTTPPVANTKNPFKKTDSVLNRVFDMLK